MNIRTNEIMLLDKRNMKMGLNNSASAVAEPPVVNPAQIMNAMNAQGMAFKGGLRVGKVALASIAALLAGASCVKQDPQKLELPEQQPVNVVTNVSQTVNVDMSAITEFQNMMMLMMQKMMENNNKNIQLLIDSFNKKFDELKEQNGNNFENFMDAFSKYVINDATYKQAILAQLETQMTKDEARIWFQALLDQIEKGEITASQALAQVIALLNNINTALNNIANKIDEFHNDYKQGNKAVLNSLMALHKDNKLTQAQLAGMSMQIAMLNANVSKIAANTDELLEIAKDDTKFEQLMDQLKKIYNKEISSKELESMLKMMGIDLKSAIYMSQAQLVAAIERFKATYIKTENEQTKKLNNIIEGIANNTATVEEFKAAFMEYAITSTENQETIINQLIENGKTEKEAKDLLADIKAQIISGKISAAEAFDKLMEVLNNIDTTVSNIYGVVVNISNQLNQFIHEYRAGKKAELQLLGGIYQNGIFQNGQLMMINQKMDYANAKLTQLNNTANELLEIAKDDTKFNELIKVIKESNSSDANYQKLEQMFKMLGITIQNAANMSAAQIINAINNFKNTYLAVEGAQQQKLAAILNQISILAKFEGMELGSLNAILAELSALGDKIDENTDAVNDNTETINQKLDEIQNKLDEISVDLKTLISDVNNGFRAMSAYYQTFVNQFNTELGKLDNIYNAIKNMANAQTITNSLLASIKAYNADLKSEQVKTNSYLKTLIDKHNQEIELLNNLDIQGGGNITIEDLDALFAKYGYKLEQFLADLDLQNLPADVATIKDLLKELNDKVQEQKDYTRQLDELSKKLDSILAKIPAGCDCKDYEEVLNKILKAIHDIKCNCQCSGNSGNNEGILDDLDNLLGQ